MFYGYVFKYGFDKDHNITVKCYAPSRYLKNEDSIVFKTGTLSERFRDVCKRAGIKAKVVAGASHKCKAEVDDGKTYFDMIKSAMSATTKATHKHYLIYDNYDTVELRKFPYKKLDIIVGDASGLTDYDYSVDIDNTYNVVKVVKKIARKVKIRLKPRLVKMIQKQPLLNRSRLLCRHKSSGGNFRKSLTQRKKPTMPR